MARKPLGVALPAVLAAVTVILLLTGVGTSALAAGETVGRVVQVKGAVALTRDGAERTLGRGDEIRLDDRIRTGAAAGVKIAFLDDSMLTIGADSELVIDSYRLGRDGRRLHAAVSLLIGILRAAITSGSASAVFDVETSVAVASARSTEWVVLAEPNHTAVFVAEGRVAVSGANLTGRALLGPGLGIDLYSDRRSAGPKRWGQGRVDEVLARTSLD